MLQASDVESWLVARLSQLSGTEPESIDVERPFVDYRLDSSLAVSLAQELGRQVGSELSITLFWEYPSIRALARALGEAS